MGGLRPSRKLLYPRSFIGAKYNKRGPAGRIPRGHRSTEAFAGDSLERRFWNKASPRRAFSASNLVARSPYVTPARVCLRQRHGGYSPYGRPFTWTCLGPRGRVMTPALVSHPALAWRVVPFFVRFRHGRPFVGMAPYSPHVASTSQPLVAHMPVGQCACNLSLFQRANLFKHRRILFRVEGLDCLHVLIDDPHEGRVAHPIACL